MLFPLWGIVRPEDFATYHRKHFHSIFEVIFVPMGLSALGVVLLCFFPPPGAPRWLLATAVALQAILFLSPFYWVPLQLKIEREGNRPELIHQLVVTHWTRVANLTFYAAAVLWLAWIRLQF